MDKKRLLELAGIKQLNEGNYSPNAVKFLQCKDTTGLGEEAGEAGELQEALFFDDGILVKNVDAAEAQEVINRFHKDMEDMD